MNRLIRGAIRNTPAMNTLMVAILVIGGFCLFQLRREVFPEFELDIILVQVPYPGATPEEVEEGICQKIEEAVRSIDGIKKQTAVAAEGAGSLVLELESGSDAQRILSEVRSEVDRISTFPELAEDPEVKQVTIRQPAITVGVVGPESDDPNAEKRLRQVTEEVRDELLRLPAVSQAEIVGAKDFQIDVEIPEETLRKYNLSLQQVANIIRRENLELPGGTIRTESQNVLVRGKNKGTIGSEIAELPIITQPNGVVLTVDDLGTVRDEFVDVDAFTRINGQPGLAVSVERTSSEDLLAMTDAVREYAKTKSLPPGYDLLIWGDRSVEVRDRLNLLLVNGLQGLALVLVLLALFMESRLAFWVSLGIPISILGACGVLYFSGHTMNMLSSFTFIMALGIVVDDAIVIGENIFTHRQMGKKSLQAALDGTLEVLPSVIASITTTVIAFIPLFFVTGVMGKFIAVMPVTMIAVLLVSLLESSLVLPCHLAHSNNGEVSFYQRALSVHHNLSLPGRWTVGWIIVGFGFLGDQLLYPFRKIGSGVSWLSHHINDGIKWFTERLYAPVLRRSLTYPMTVVCLALAILLTVVGMIRGGLVPFVIFPKLDSNTIVADVVFPDGTPADVTDKATQKIENAIRRVNEQFEEEGHSVLRLTRRSVGHATQQSGPGQMRQAIGSHLGSVTAELVDTSKRRIESDKIVSAWRRETGKIPGAETLTFGSRDMGPGGTPIEFKLLAETNDFQKLEEAVKETKDRLDEYPGVFDIADDSNPGKWEFQLRIKEDAVAMGVPLAELAETVRATYYGEEVMRLQRGRHEVKLMVRYPEEDRRSLADFEEIRIRNEEGVERPLTELADVRVERGYTEINRVNQLRAITISADVDEGRANAREIVQNLQTKFMPDLLERYPSVSVRWEGQQEQTNESVNSLMAGLAVAMVAMFALLTWQFTSYFQPTLIMAIIPFGIVGVVIGHALLGMSLTLFSLFGLVTLTGIVVNDSIVLIDFINAQVRNGMPVKEALMLGGQRRLRPILLTSMTTIAGLFPLLLEQSFQAQILIPMAVSICFGLLFSTVFCLILVPTFYLLHARLTGHGAENEEKEAEQLAASSQKLAAE